MRGRVGKRHRGDYRNRATTVGGGSSDGSTHDERLAATYSGFVALALLLLAAAAWLGHDA